MSNTSVEQIRTGAVLGAGTMGNGIAQACAVVGIDVVMVNVAQGAVDRGVAAGLLAIADAPEAPRWSDNKKNASYRR